MEEAGLPVWQYVETSSTVNLILYNIFDERLVYKNKVLISVIAKILDKFGHSTDINGIVSRHCECVVLLSRVK